MRCSGSTITLSKYCYLRLTFHLFSTLPEPSSPSHFSPSPRRAHLSKTGAAGCILCRCSANLPPVGLCSITSDFLTRALLWVAGSNASNGRTPQSLPPFDEQPSQRRPRIAKPRDVCPRVTSMHQFDDRTSPPRIHRSRGSCCVGGPLLGICQPGRE